MELLTTIPLRANGTVIVDLKFGGKKIAKYTFTEDEATGAGVCEVDDEHASLLLNRGHFMSRSEYEEEAALLKKMAERDARMKRATSAPTPGTFNPLDMNSSNDEEDPVNSMAPPEEGGTRPTGRVRKASK